MAAASGRPAAKGSAAPSRSLPRGQTARRAVAATRGRAVVRGAAPSLREERRLLRLGHRWLAAVDEVGRGALAGPVSVGIVLVDLDTGSAPSGVRDSKLLTPAAREKLVPRLRRWAPHHAVGHTQPEEIDRIGIIAALRLAACRALAQLPVRPDCALLDGNHNWLHAPTSAVLAAARSQAQAGGTAELFALEPDPELEELEPSWVPPVVVTRIKADLRCAAVAAASVLAKVERDARMTALAARHPGYGWAENKGYSAPEHIEALRRLGVTPLHRQSWSLPGLIALDGAGLGQSTIEDLTGLHLPEPVNLNEDLDGDELDEAELDGDELDEAELGEGLDLAELEPAGQEPAGRFDLLDLEDADLASSGILDRP
jgi:ribonuclease HII